METRHAGKQELAPPKRGSSLHLTKLPWSDSVKGVWIGGGGRKSSGRCSRRMIATRLRTWKVRADLRKVVMDEVAQDVSWASEKGTKRLVRLPMSLMRAWAWAPRESKVETTKVTTLMRAPGGGPPGWPKVIVTGAGSLQGTMAPWRADLAVDLT